MVDRNSFEPLYIQIRKDIEEQILNGTIKIGDKLMSETEMLQYYNVGRVTVRAALAELVLSGCLKKERGMGTFCVAMPKREVRRNVDVILNMQDTYFVPHILAGISRVLEKRNCNLVLHDTRDSMDSIAQTLFNILGHGTDGVIIQPYTGPEVVSEECRSAAELCEERQIPLVTIDGKFREMDIPCVMNNDNQGGLTATRYMIQMGHKKILGVFRERFRDSMFRMTGYIEAMREAGLEPYVVDSDKQSFEEILKIVKEEGITAMIFYNDLLAVEYYHEFDRVGVKVPEDVSVIGYDNTELSETSMPKLTSITHPKERMGEKTAEMLLKLMEGKTLSERRYMFEPGLVARDSVKRLV